MDESEVMAMLAGKRSREQADETDAALAIEPSFDDPWSMDVKLAVTPSSTVHDHTGSTMVIRQVALPPIYCTVRPVAPGDEAALHAFGLCGLSEESRRLFAPYTWDGPADSLQAQFTQSIANSQSHRDLHLVALSANKVCGHAFLWSMVDEVPELGLAVVDAWHGRGLGRQLLSLLEKVCVSVGKPAIELTTTADNERAHAIYLKFGFEDLGFIRNPIGCDVVAAFAGRVVASDFRIERQMVKVLDEHARTRVLAAMADKRRRAAELFGSGAGGLESAT